jgi:phage shock protein A
MIEKKNRFRRSPQNMERMRALISRWRDQALAGLPALFDDRLAQDQATKEAEWEKEREGLYAEIGRLSTQLGWLKKRWKSA